MRILSPALFLMATLCSCSGAPPIAYTNKGDPERQLVITTEAAVIALDDRDSIARLKETLRTDRPALARLHCPEAAALCAQAEAVLRQAGITPDRGRKDAEAAEDEEDSETVTLIYRRTAAAECDHRYVDNSLNSANIAMSQLGCSLRSNMVQMVTDRQQFVNPGLLDYMDGEKAARNYQNYLTPAQPGESGADSGGASLIGAAAQ